MTARPDPDPRDSGREPAEDPTPRPPYAAPAPLSVAAGLVLVEGLLTALYGVSELVHLDSGRLVMGLTTSLFLLAYGAALLVCARGLHLVRPWARGPVLFAQLAWLGLAWNLREGDTVVAAVVLAVSAVLVLAGLLHPRSIDALERAAGRA